MLLSIVYVFNRMVVEDGSGCGHVYGSGGVVRECLQVSSSEWQDMCSLLDDVGEVVYSRTAQHQVHV